MEITVDRKTFLGSTDCAAILGLSRYKSPLTLWAEKTGKIEPENISGKLAVRLGTKLEPTVAELFQEQTGKQVQKAGGTVFHKDYPFLGATLDYKLIDEDAILEIKTTATWRKEEWANGEVPAEYLCQVMHQLMVTDADKAYIACLIGNEDLQIREIERDEKAIQELRKKEVAFWNESVLPGVMPEVITKDDAPTLYKLFPKAQEGAEIDLGDEGRKLLESRQALRQDLYVVESQIATIENELRVMLKESEAGRAGNWLVTWKEVLTNRIDLDRLKKEAAHIYAEYLEPNHNRQLRVKEIKYGNT